MKTLTIVKIGGAVLTDKKGRGDLRHGLIKMIAANLKSALLKKPQRLILVLGAGGKVHATAKKYRLHLGAISRSQIAGALKTHSQAKQLQMTVCEILSRYLLVVPLQTNNFFFVNERGQVIIKNIGYIAELLKKHFTPVFYGDMIYHPTKNFVILSGDKISILLARSLKANKVIFATDVEGVYTDAKHIGNSQHLLKEISVNNLKSILANISSFQARDTTGELPGKLKEIMHKPKLTDVYIVNGLRPTNISSVLRGSKVGTRII